MSRNIAPCVVLLFAVSSLAPRVWAEPVADPILTWNEVATDVFRANTSYQNPGMTSRSMAMMNLAMYDAVNAVSPEYTTFYSQSGAPAGASSQAAAVGAAYSVLSNIYIDQLGTLDAALATSLAGIADGPGKAAGLAYGQSVGLGVYQARQGDGFDHSIQYTESDAPGRWQADPLNPGQQAWGPAWGQMQSFALSNPADHAPPPTPALNSQQFADSYNEVKSLGARFSTTRTQEQTDIGLFWAYDRTGMGTPMVLFNDAMRTIASDQGNTFEENARMFAMASVAMADAGIVAWDSKFANDFWRPVTGIRRGDEDGNPLTDADIDWVPLGAPGGVGPSGEIIADFTPPFPTYVSGHASFGGALFESLAAFYGSDDIAFTLTSDELIGAAATRSFTSLSQAMAENGRSRVYLGIHWDFDDYEGQYLGQGVAREISSNYFQPIPEPTTLTLLVLSSTLLLRRTPRKRTPACRL